MSNSSEIFITFNYGEKLRDFIIAQTLGRPNPRLESFWFILTTDHRWSDMGPKDLQKHQQTIENWREIKPEVTHRR